MKKYNKSKLAIQRDKWFESEEGKKCLDISILKNPSLLKYLKNRLETAYLAGAKHNDKKS